MNRFVCVAVGAAVCLAAGGCLIVTGNTRHETGVRVSDSTLSQVEPGKTTEAWLLASLGEPTARTRIDCDKKVEILRYEHSTRRVRYCGRACT